MPTLESASMAIDGRYHLLDKRSISPYFGGGLTWGWTRYEAVKRKRHVVCLESYGDSGAGDALLWLLFLPFSLVSGEWVAPLPEPEETGCNEWGYEWRNHFYTYTGKGFGANGIIGIEFRHLHKSRFNLALRIDTPFYELEFNRRNSSRSANQEGSRTRSTESGGASTS